MVLRAAAYPSPTSRETAIRLNLPAGGPVHTTIYDATGRAVRRFGEELLAAGAHVFPWDGRDDAGRAVAPGVYLARVSTPEGAKTARVVIIR